MSIDNATLGLLIVCWHSSIDKQQCVFVVKCGPIRI